MLLLSLTELTCDRLWYPTSLIFMDSFSESGSSMLATTEGSQVLVLCFPVPCECIFWPLNEIIPIFLG